MKTITIQPQQRPNGTLPYPYHIDNKGNVGRQDFWKGEPLKLICFANKSNDTISTLTFKEFWKTPKETIGKYPVFEHKNGEWYTYQDIIENIRINIKK